MSPAPCPLWMTAGATEANAVAAPAKPVALAIAAMAASPLFTMSRVTLPSGALARPTWRIWPLDGSFTIALTEPAPSLETPNSHVSPMAQMTSVSSTSGATMLCA